MPIAVGSKAPDFTLKTKTADGPKDVKLSDNFGKTQTVLNIIATAPVHGIGFIVRCKTGVSCHKIDSIDMCL